RLGRGAIAAGMDHDGKIVVFALSGLGRHGLIDGLNYTVKNPDGSFAAAKPVDLPQQSSSRGPLPVQNIYQIHARTIDGKLYVAVMGLTGLPSAIAQMPYLALSNWSDNPGRFHTTPEPWPTLPLDWFEAYPFHGFWTRHTQTKTPIAFSFYISKNVWTVEPKYGFVTFNEFCECQEFIPCPVSNGWVTSAAVDLHDMDLHRLSRNRI